MKTILAAVMLVAAPAAAAPLDDVAAALASTRTMTADFVQTSGGRQARGTMLLVRPGKVRFDYAASSLLVVADGRTLSMIDYSVGQVSQWPIRSSPLAALLDPAKDLARVARVVGDTPAGVRVEARDPAHPEYGALTLAFARSGGGLALTGWTAHDAQGGVTEVSLSNVRTNIAVANGKFSFRDPRARVAGRPS